MKGCFFHSLPCRQVASFIYSLPYRFIPFPAASCRCDSDALPPVAAPGWPRTGSRSWDGVVACCWQLIRRNPSFWLRSPSCDSSTESARLTEKRRRRPSRHPSPSLSLQCRFQVAQWPSAQQRKPASGREALCLPFKFRLGPSRARTRDSSCAGPGRLDRLQVGLG